MQQYEKSEPYLRRSIEVWTEVFDENHGSNAWAWNALAQNYRKRGMFDKARDAANRALAINEGVYDADHQNTAASVLILANIARDEARYADAKPLYERALASNEARFGPEGSRTVEVLNDYLAFLELAGPDWEAEQVKVRLANARN